MSALTSLRDRVFGNEQKSGNHDDNSGQVRLSGHLHSGSSSYCFGLLAFCCFSSGALLYKQIGVLAVAEQSDGHKPKPGTAS